MEDLLRIGVVTTTHGIKGEVKVFPTTDDVKRFKKCYFDYKRGKFNASCGECEIF